MSLFLSVFFALYAGAHCYAFIKALSAFAFGAGAGLVLSLFMLLMTFMPFIIHYLEKYGLDALARPAAFTGYMWMGLLFLFCAAAAPLDCYRTAVSAAAFLSGKDLSGISLSGYQLFMAAFMISLAAALYGYFDAKNIRTENLLIKTGKLSRETGRLRIVQISDVHLGLIVREERLKRILSAVKDAGPDILVSTGDLIDGELAGQNGLSEMIKEITPRHGKFAVTGNHEYYAGITQSLNFTREAGFTILSGSAVSGPITIAGVDDPAASAFRQSPPISEKNLLQAAAREAGDKFVLLLKHRPLVDSGSSGLFDLQLSGHTHKGQICPFGILTKIYYPVYTGYRKLQGNAHLYVSRGSGTWGPPIRFLAPPEITVIDLVHA